MEVFRGECNFSQSAGGGGTDIKCDSPLLLTSIAAFFYSNSIQNLQIGMYN